MQPVANQGLHRIQAAYKQHIMHDFLRWQQSRMQGLLRRLGADFYDLLLPESHALALFLHPGEQLLGVVYGRYHNDKPGGAEIGRGMLVATDQRVLLVDKKPLFTKCDELAYFVISGVTYSKTPIGGTVVLHTRPGDIHIRTFNPRCAMEFTEAIEMEVFHRSERSAKWIIT